ncbi:hypothetical protein C3V43_11685 [Bacteroides heparinolyticus]|uniref:NVEALA protein n=1 Tax=Bacteroides zoogleoformans TaxID=28119 RepID=A0ABN5ILB6_9BACE|nr:MULTISPECIES: NVEALA domain-containing protein [Bacteroides]AVM53688.1 hypothetical protein C4H11_12890 [Bacteroides zoogleoformans]AVM58334.1 hypothetical protein C3V43_11685 [Bacteroides heparinolyticus]TWJ18087.1 NVEALA protein [Bacteroides zoogleoformans]
MSKKIFAILIVAVVAVFAGYNAYQSQRAETVSDLLLANVEALARDEANSNGNSGPSELYDCPFWFTGDGIHCKCENTAPCTAVLCK